MSSIVADLIALVREVVHDEIERSREDVRS